MLKKRYMVKRTTLLGPDPGDDEEGHFLNRVITRIGGHTSEEKIKRETDSRHAMLIVRQLGIQKAKVADTPAVKRTEKHELQIDSETGLATAENSIFRFATVRSVFKVANQA